MAQTKVHSASSLPYPQLPLATVSKLRPEALKLHPQRSSIGRLLRGYAVTPRTARWPSPAYIPSTGGSFEYAPLDVNRHLQRVGFFFPYNFIIRLSFLLSGSLKMMCQLSFD